jgi:hypothetical protein
MKTEAEATYVLCVRNEDYEASLELRKIYQIVPDAEAQKNSLIRVIDESGEDYLFPASFFVAIQVPEEAVPAFGAAT